VSPDLSGGGQERPMVGACLCQREPFESVHADVGPVLYGQLALAEDHCV